MLQVLIRRKQTHTVSVIPLFFFSLSSNPLLETYDLEELISK